MQGLESINRPGVNNRVYNTNNGMFCYILLLIEDKTYIELNKSIVNSL